MTGFRRRNHGSGHSYYLGDRKLDGVTTILSKGLPKHLTKWAAEAAAGYVVDNWDDLVTVTPSARFKLISKAPNAARDAAAVRGTKVHALADKLTHGQEVAVPDDLAGHVERVRQVPRRVEPAAHPHRNIRLPRHLPVRGNP